jgi:lysozyme
MELSQQGLEFIKRRESFRDKAYKDVAGIWTIGYGTIRIDGRPVRPTDTCTEEVASIWIRDEATKDHVVPLNKALAGIPLSQNQFDSLVSLSYNVGSAGTLSSTLVRTLKTGGLVTEDMFTRWSKARVNGQLVVVQGLLNRRQMEWQMFSIGVYE